MYRFYKLNGKKPTFLEYNLHDLCKLMPISSQYKKPTLILLAIIEKQVFKKQTCPVDFTVTHYSKGYNYGLRKEKKKKIYPCTGHMGGRSVGILQLSLEGGY